VVYSGGVKSWSMISCLQDLGIEVTAVGIKKAGKSDQEKIEVLVGKERMISDTSPSNLLRLIKETQADFLIAGSRNQYLAYKEKIPYLDINQERHHAYGGYEGIIQLAKDLVHTLESPVWQIARKDAPWDVPFAKIENSLSANLENKEVRHET
jgi:nitrogenase molybdenum-cofactor synthesis protein NifE